MSNSSTRNTLITIGGRIRKARRERGLTQEQLAAPQFTKGYVSALERGAVRPSLKALEFLAQRLELPITHFLAGMNTLGETPPTGSGSIGVEAELDLQAVEEDLRYQINFAKMLIRTNKVDEAFQLLAEAEENARPYWRKLPDRIRYLIPYTRGRAYIQLTQAARAQPELEAALELAKSDALATATTRNLLGVMFYELGKANLALEHHLQCLQAIHSGVVKDRNLSLSMYRNLANDYWALSNPSLAITIYKEALDLLKDLDDLERQAGLYWGLALAYCQERRCLSAKRRFRLSPEYR